MRIDPFTLLKARLNYFPVDDNSKSICNQYKDMFPIFPECEVGIKRLFDLNTEAGDCETTHGEDEMYGDILRDCFSSELIKLDLNLQVYYTLLERKNKDLYIPLKEKEWSKEKKDEIQKKRKECRRNKKNGLSREEPFRIVEKDNSLKNKKEKTYYGEVMIQDFAPNMCRWYYLSSKFRNIFGEVRKLDKYKFSEIKKIFQEANIKRKEEIWLSENLLGINLSLALYSFFSVILKDTNYTTIEKDYAGVIREIIEEIMSLEGIYSRCVIVHKLKIIYELRVKSRLYTSSNTPQETLEYLYKQVLRQYMPECVKQYNYIKFYALGKYEKDGTDNTSAIEKLEKDCDKLLSEYFEFSEEYYLINELSKEIENEKLYALIQSIVISNHK